MRGNPHEDANDGGRGDDRADNPATTRSAIRWRMTGRQEGRLLWKTWRAG
jgi:hypothetical protein